MTKKTKGSPVKRADRKQASPLNVPFKHNERQRFERAFKLSKQDPRTSRASYVRQLVDQDAEKKGVY